MSKLLDTEKFLKLYRWMYTARAMDRQEESLAHQGEIFFYVPGSGHEATAALIPYLNEHDWLHCHYRDRALALARGVTIESLFLTLLGKAESSSGGRRMPGFTSDPDLHILSATTLVGNNALQAAGVADAIKERAGNPLVLCSLGDGATQEGEVLEALAECKRCNLPVLFLVQDNSFALSTPTKGRTFYSTPDGEQDNVYGIEIQRVDGSDPEMVDRVLASTVSNMRKNRSPQVVIMKTERLSSHTNADDQTVYRGQEAIERGEQDHDPVKNLRQKLLAEGVKESSLEELEASVRTEIKSSLQSARSGEDPVAELGAKKDLPAKCSDPESEYGGSDKADLTLLGAMRTVLQNQLANDQRVGLYGEDIADPKGDVFGLTRGLSSAFPNQVKNSPLAESTIVGTAIGKALAGERPVACLQFADFIPVTYNQIQAELGSIYWRTKGQWNAPVIIMTVCGAYRPGLGPFHAQTPTGLTARVPGLDVFAPSTASDAAGLLNAAFESERPSVFFYPKSLLNDPERMTSADIEKHWTPIGKARKVRKGDDITIVSWGSTLPLCEEAATALEEGASLTTDLFDLRTISPWDSAAIIRSASRTGRLLVVDEDLKNCGVGGEILATVAEEAKAEIQMARVCAENTYIPFNFQSQMEVIPSLKSILTKASDMLNFDLRWEKPIAQEEGSVTVKAIGSSPSDKTIQIVELHAAEEDQVAEGDQFASVEANKAAMEIELPAAGQIERIFVKEGDEVEIGTPLVRIKTTESAEMRPKTEEDPGTPILTRRKTRIAQAKPAAKMAQKPVTISSICSALGSRLLTNEDLIKNCSDWNPEDIVRRTGIEKRHWIGDKESVLSLGTQAARSLLERENLDISDIDAIICSTGTPLMTTPSLACRILHQLTPEGENLLIQASDINAACSGYLYGLQQGYDLLSQNPDHKIMLVTAETLSPVLNPDDPGTYFLFGDAATASLLSCEKRNGNINARVERPVLSAMGVDQNVLYVPSIQSNDHVQMEGKSVFRLAVRKMIDILDEACSESNLTVDELDMIVPHQANKRIIEAIRRAIKFPTEKVCYYIRETGNTSSNTIPLSLEELMHDRPCGSRIGMTAFGGGLTFAAGLLEKY